MKLTEKNFKAYNYKKRLKNLKEDTHNKWKSEKYEKVPNGTSRVEKYNASN